MENEFNKVMSERTDDQLIKIVTSEREKYNPTAILSAENEIQKRNIDTSKFEEIKQKVQTEKIQKETVEKNVVTSFTRFLHFIIDSIIWLIISFIASMFVALILQSASELTISFIIVFVYLVSFIAYYSIMEIKFQKTVAKFITKTTVVNQNGTNPTNADIFTRTICRLIPFDRISFLFVKNGIHDFLSKTNVVKDIREVNTNGNNI